jgi:hypothetical protein
MELLQLPFKGQLAFLNVIAYYACMNSRHRKTLHKVFTVPTLSNIEWKEIESLLLAVDCKLTEGSGSRVKFTFGVHTLNLHRPHPAKEALKYQVRDAQAFLEKIGVKP